MSDETLRVLITGIEKDISSLAIKIANIEEEVWGYPKGKGLGLLQKVRDNNKKWTIVWAVCIFIFGIMGRIGGGLLDKFVADWVYNSPSERYIRESKRPKIRINKIYIKREAEPKSKSTSSASADTPE